MLGNDLIDLDLALIQSNWKRKGYLARVFNAAEQRTILLSQDPDLMVWLLWSMKEASYKIHNRNSGLRRYEPLAYSCTLEMDGELGGEGTVRRGNESFSCRSAVCESMLHTVALCNGAVFAKVKKVFMENHEGYHRTFGSQSGLVLSKCQKGLPMVSEPISCSAGPASVSHHGRGLCVVYFSP